MMPGLEQIRMTGRLSLMLADREAHEQLTMLKVEIDGLTFGKPGESNAGSELAQS